jgi:hypothetical protein
MSSFIPAASSFRTARASATMLIPGDLLLLLRPARR